MNKPLALGLDLGGSSIKWGLVNSKGDIIKKGKTGLDDLSPSSVIHSLGNIITSVLKEHRDEVLAIGLGSPGLLDHTRRIVRYSPNFPEWKNVPLAEKLETVAEGVPVFVENDANLLVFSETRWGAAVGEKDVIMLTLGTGVGGGVMVNGQLLTGSGGGGGELGYITVDPDGPDYVVNRGCLESYCNIRGVLRTAKEVYGDMEFPGSPEALAQAAKDGDADAVRVWEFVGHQLGIGIATLINIFNPRLVLVGGGVSGAGEFLLEPARKSASERSHVENFSEVEIRQAGLGAESGLYGAAALAFAKSGIQ